MEPDETIEEKVKAEYSVSDSEEQIADQIVANVGSKAIIIAALELLLVLGDHDLLDFIRESDNCGAYDGLKREAGLS